MPINPFRFAFNPAPQQPTTGIKPLGALGSDDGNLMNDEQIRGLRRQAAQQAARGADTSPIQSPWQGAARLAEGFNAGLDEARADRADDALRGVANRNAWQLGGAIAPDEATVDPLDLNGRRKPFAGILGIGRSISSLLGGGSAPGGTTGELY